MIRNILFVAVTSAAITLLSCNNKSTSGDVAFAKDAFSSLIAGDAAVMEKIDWETFTSLGAPVGSQYVTINNDADKSAFKKAFVTQFSSSFRESGGSINDFSNWRVDSVDETHTKVIADSAKGTLKLTVSERNSIERISAMEIVQ